MIDLTAIDKILSRYKENFSIIHDREIYKWTAVAHFLCHWDCQAPDFKTMILSALQHCGELMDAGQYFPKRMLTEYLNFEPERVRALFSELYDESNPLADRMIAFSVGMDQLRDQFTPGKRHYQDPRAIMVYLNMRYPDKYFLYKLKMFTGFAARVNYPYHINPREKFENALCFQSLCQIVRQHVVADPALIKLHHGRLTKAHYPDTSYHLLTQDIIYAASEWEMESDLTGSLFTIELTTDQHMEPRQHQLQLKGRHIEFMERAIAQKNLGDLGEQVVLDYERDKLHRAGIKNKTPLPTSKLEGDGLGYDIDSFDEKGKPVLIEVKTTRSRQAPFYITEAELQQSIQSANRYYLYRLYDFDPKAARCKLIIYKGSLQQFCINPIAYYVPYELTT